MALWLIMNAKGVTQAEQFDDGLAFMPGEDGYSTDGVSAHAASLGKGYSFSLIGVPNWHARIEAEQKEADEAAQAAAAAEAEAAQAAANAAARAAEEADRAAADDARKAAAQARIAELLDPAGAAKARAIAAIQGEHAELVAFASPADKKALAKVLDARLAALDELSEFE